MAYEGNQDSEFASTAVPFEAIPELATNPEFAAKMERARQCKRAIEACEKELEELRIECGAMVAVTGGKSVSYLDLVITNVDGSTPKGKLTGKGIELAAAGHLTAANYRAIAMAAKDCDEKVLLENGLPAILIAQGREPDKPRAGSTQFSWVGAKGKGAKKRAEGSGGPVQ